jgi:DNA-binding NtrC family response regulator
VKVSPNIKQELPLLAAPRMLFEQVPQLPPSSQPFMRQTQVANLSQPWANCSLPDEVLLYESKLIRQALDMANGSVVRAARLLGIKHQTLSFILQGQHKSLQAAINLAPRRKRSIMRAP